MSVNATSNVSNQVSKDYGKYNTAKTTTENKTSEEAEQKVTQVQDTAAVYDKNEQSQTLSAYTVNKMSKEQRDALVEKLKADQAQRQQSLLDLAREMISKQANTFGIASDDDVWKFFASGKFEVDEETRAKAKQDISEDGYYGVKQTSQRLFDFACALAGDNVEKMKEMQAAIEKGYKQAEKTWGKELPEICKKTMDATNKMFDDYYASKKSSVDTNAGNDVKGSLESAQNDA